MTLIQLRDLAPAGSVNFSASNSNDNSQIINQNVSNNTNLSISSESTHDISPLQISDVPQNTNLSNSSESTNIDQSSESPMPPLRRSMRIKKSRDILDL